MADSPIPLPALLPFFVSFVLAFFIQGIAKPGD